jgi:hypothetical protein
MTTEQGDLSTQKPHRSNYGLGRDWSKSAVPQHRCKAHRKNGEQCKNASLIGSAVCRYHGGAAKQCVNAARIRLQNAAEKMARELLGMATDPNVSDSVKLAAIRDALDRAGFKPVTAVDLEVSTKPWEHVFEGISKVVAGPRDPQATPAELPAADPEILGEFDDDEIEDDPYAPRVEPQREWESADVVYVEIVSPDGYTDQIMSDHPTTPGRDDSSASEPHGPGVGPLGPNGPTGSGLMSLADAVEAASEMRARAAAARTRDMRRR